jgi:hypothetical protein
MSTPPIDSSAVDKLYQSLARADVAGARACCAPDARIWHNFDCIALTLDQACVGWNAFIAAFPERNVTDVRRAALLGGGFLQRHLQVIRSTDGVWRAWPICIIVSIDNGLITRLDEYMDRAGSLTRELTTTPGLP